MAKKQIGSKVLRGINWNLSGQNEVIVVQKNGVIRVKRLGKQKRRVKRPL